jgi:hypothetical protein
MWRCEILQHCRAVFVKPIRGVQSGMPRALRLGPVEPVPKDGAGGRMGASAK